MSVSSRGFWESKDESENSNGILRRSVSIESRDSNANDGLSQVSRVTLLGRAPSSHNRSQDLSHNISVPPSMASDGQFEDAPILVDQPSQILPQNPREGLNFIDEELEWSDPADEDEDSDSIDEGYDDNRVEDEDWEVAEGGSSPLSSWNTLKKN